ncbi:MAG: carboxypeptidase regulatory-like domain-containing protein [Balneolaceae bacterium]|nr:carboxypeptidase regulatory-like domain-containing protein [Balneolaceae bacterium]
MNDHTTRSPITPIVIFMLLFSFTAAHAQSSGAQDSETYSLTLKVTDAETGEALANAQIEILGRYNPMSVNSEGQLVIDQIETDPHTFKIYAEGYETWKKTVTVTKDSRLTVALTPAE